MAGTAVSTYGGVSLGGCEEKSDDYQFAVHVCVMLLERTIWYACCNSPNTTE